MEFWNCNQDRISGKYYLDTDQSIQCFNLGSDGGEWKQLAGLGIFMLIAYPVGILVIFFSLLTIARHHLEDPTVTHMLGPLYENYKSKQYYWELLILARKALILAFNVFFSQSTLRAGLRQTVATQAVLLACLLGHMYTWPYHNHMINILEAVNLVATFFAAFVGMALLSNQTGKLSGGFVGFLTALAIISTGIAGIASFGSMIFEIFPKFVNAILAQRKNRRIRERNQKRREAMRMARRMGEQFRDVESMNRTSLSVSLRVREFVRRAVVGFRASRMLTAGGVRASFNMAKDQDSALPPHGLMAQAYEALHQIVQKKETLSLRNIDPTPMHRMMRKDAQEPFFDALLTAPRADAMRVRKFFEETMLPREVLLSVYFSWSLEH